MFLFQELFFFFHLHPDVLGVVPDELEPLLLQAGDVVSVHLVTVAVALLHKVLENILEKK